MRIISWNVNGLRANVKKGGFDWLMNENADIFCLQETKAHPEQLEDSIRNPEGYHAFFDHSKVRKGYSGVATFSKMKPANVEYGLGIEKYDQEGRFIAIFMENAIKDIPLLAIINNYFPNGGGGPDRLQFKLEYYEEYIKYINRLKKKGYEIIFCGDINTAHTEIDLARPKENVDNTGFLPVERKWIDDVIDNRYFDVFRKLHPDKKDAYTYWDMKTFARERNVGWRIDYFFATQKVLEMVTKARIFDEIMGSDHCPIDIVIG